MTRTPVARGDRRKDVWIEKDARQLTKVRHTFPDNAPPRQGPALDSTASKRLKRATDAASVPEEPSAWEALDERD